MMRGGSFLDTNVLLYALAEDDLRTPRAEALLAEGPVISVQVLNEFTAVARRKLKLDWQHIANLIAIARQLCGPVQPLTPDMHDNARTLADRHRLSIYDAAIVASALAAGCATLWSEDMQNGHSIEGLTIRNPFS
jgi:predicted nucleic acid-binding protein